jgi:elongation factor G
VRLKPGPRGSGYRFVDSIVGGAIPRQYIPAVDKGVQEAAQRGVLAGFPVVDFVAECYEGSSHSVDSNEASFRMAGILAFKAVAEKCRPVLLEPLDQVEVVVPEAYLGDVMGDLSARRGHIVGTEPTGQLGEVRVRAVVPQAELHLYATTLQSLTHGRARYAHRFERYDVAPAEVVKALAAG